MKSARDFSKVAPVVWWSRKFRGLSDRGKIGYLYILSNGHVTSAGCYELPDGYACADLEWSPDEWEAIRGELIAAGMIDHDPTNNVVLVEQWFRFNGPMNDKHAKGTLRFLESVESERLREKAIGQFREADAERVAKAAAKDAEKRAELVARVANTAANHDRLTGTRFMAGGRTG